MKKTICLLLCLAMLSVPCLGEEGGPVGIASPSAILMHRSGKVLMEKDADQPLEPASVTKVMTMLLIMEALENGQIALTDMVTGSAHAASMGGSQVWLKEGEQLSVDDMLKCIAIASANDCAVAMAEHLGGTEDNFVAMMNQRALELGMKNTHFVNCCGLPAEGHVTTARDIALMSAELLRHEEIKAYTTTWMDTIRGGEFTLANTNKLLKSFDGMTGLKTGSTSTAGFCLSGTAERDGMELIAVVLKAPDSKTRNADIAALLNYGFTNFAEVQVTPDRPLMPIPVILGEKAEVGCQLAPTAPMVLNKAQAGAAEKSVTLAESLKAPVDQGQKVGTLTITSGGAVLAELPIVATESVKAQSLWDIFKGILSYSCMRG